MNPLAPLWELINRKFIGVPKARTLSDSVEYLDNSLWAEIIRSEATHFLSSGLVGLLVFSLTWIILSRRHGSIWSDRLIFHISFLYGLCASVTIHMLLDGCTKLC